MVLPVALPVVVAVALVVAVVVAVPVEMEVEVAVAVPTDVAVVGSAALIVVRPHVEVVLAVVLAVVLVVDMAGCGLCLRGGGRGERLHQSLAAALAVVLDVLADCGGRPRSGCPWRLAVFLAVEWPCRFPRR